MDNSILAFLLFFFPSHEKTCFIVLVKEFVMPDYNTEL